MPLRAIDTAVYNNGTSRTVTVPASAEVGDFATLIVGRSNSSIVSDLSGSGWTLHGSSAATVTGGQITVWTKTVTVPDIGATVTVEASSATRWAMAVMVRYGVLGLDVEPTFSTTSTTTATPEAPSITTISGNAELVNIYGSQPYNSGGVVTFTVPVGQTKIVDISSTNGSSVNACFAIGEEILGPAGASGNRSAVSENVVAESDDRVRQGTVTLAYATALEEEPSGLMVNVRQGGAWAAKPLKVRVGGNWIWED